MHRRCLLLFAVRPIQGRCPCSLPGRTVGQPRKTLCRRTQEPEPVTSTRLHVDVRRSVALHSRALHPELPPRCYRLLTMPARSLDKSSLSRGSYRTPMLVRLAQVGGTSSVRVDEDNASRRSSQFSFLSGIWSWPLGLSGICSCV